MTILELNVKAKREQKQQEWVWETDDQVDLVKLMGWYKEYTNHQINVAQLKTAMTKVPLD